MPVRAHVREREKSEKNEFTESVCARMRKKGNRHKEAREKRKTQRVRKKRGVRLFQ